MTKEERDGTPTGAELEETDLASQGDVFDTPELPSGEDDSLRIQMDGTVSANPNRVDLRGLDQIDRRILRESFRVARRLQQRLELDYMR